MTDIMSGRVDLADFQLLAACGGFSYGDVLGGGGGWAGSIAYNPRAREQFMDFFARPDTLTLGVCNGCQMLARLKDLIPGAQGWPLFTTNRSQRFEARLSMVRVEATKSAFFTGMEGSLIPVPLAHGEGFANFAANQTDPDLASVCLRYANANGDTASTYPANPNGSPDGITGVTSEDGRATILMPHPERLQNRATQLASPHVGRNRHGLACLPTHRLGWRTVTNDWTLSELRKLSDGRAHKSPDDEPWTTVVLDNSPQGESLTGPSIYRVHDRGNTMLIKNAQMTSNLQRSPIRSFTSSRRRFLRTSTGAMVVATVPGLIWPSPTLAARAKLDAARNPLYSPDLDPTEYKYVTGYNNFYEFGTDKGDPAKYAQDFKPNRGLWRFRASATSQASTPTRTS